MASPALSSVLSASLLVLLLGVPLISAAPDGALVTYLPGFNGTLPSKHYAGYVTIDEDHGKNLFYYFVVSERNPLKDPVVVWLNGGPGCSSFNGFVYEHGPFNFEAGGAPGSLPQLHLNPYSWSKVSNIIYLDAPAGVGMSYSLNKSDYITGDLKTARDSHKFILKWFELYPEFLANPFFICGESYAGVFVPTFSYEVAKGIEAGVKPNLNFKGYSVGNGVTDTVFDGDALVPFARGMGLISEDMFQEVSTACQGSYWNPVNGICGDKLERVNWEVSNLNKYNILEPCYRDNEIREPVPDDSRLPSSFRSLGEKRMSGRSWPLRAPVGDGRDHTWLELGGSLPCMDEVVATSWLNNEAVRNAIHARPESEIGTWVLHKYGVLDYNYDAGSMIKYHKSLTARNYRALIYSGDHDMNVPYTGTEAWTRSLGYRITDPWRPWYSDGQVAGYTKGYDHNLTFATVKGAGHTVPQSKPKEALALYSRYLVGEPI